MSDPAVPAGSLPSVDRMRVATLNLWGRSGAWTDRRSLLVDGFRDLRPELVAFQESIKTDDYDQVTDLLGDDFHVVHQQARAADGMGVSIASRWPLGQVREVDLHVTSRTADFPCATLVAEILAPNPVGPLLSSTTFHRGSRPSSMSGSCKPCWLRGRSKSWPTGAAGTWCWLVISMPILTRPACASGPAGRP
jgi:hypothetical protein